MNDTQNEKETENKFHITAEYNEIKWITGTERGFEIPRMFKEHARLKRWCIENCEDDICYYVSSQSYTSSDIIYFYADEDAVAYKLTWE